MKRILKDLAFQLTCMYMGASLSEALVTFAESMLFQPPDPDNYRIARDVTELFNFMATQPPVDGHADVDRVVPIQLALQGLDYDLGPCATDGIPGGHFLRAVTKFQRDHLLPETGAADGATIRMLAHEVEADPALAAELDRRMIAPYRREDVQNHMKDLPAFFSWTAGYDFIYRPDFHFYTLLAFVKRDVIESLSAAKFGGCANTHQRDAFRHAGMTIYLASFPGVSTALAVDRMNLRERASDNALPLRLMDMFNHGIAGRLSQQMLAQGHNFDADGIADRIVAAVKDGTFFTHPVPLVPKDFR